ncbi:unnamed protein product [Rangifer tarandus platyrhynchus]|uniref:Uncharacterized protein n=1 Tax=Rangifer tarandus platyrhynchus TaxID=3082113 RepID=A0AC59YHQ2_RANTA
MSSGPLQDPALATGLRGDVGSGILPTGLSGGKAHRSFRSQLRSGIHRVSALLVAPSGSRVSQSGRHGRAAHTHSASRRAAAHCPPPRGIGPRVGADVEAGPCRPEPGEERPVWRSGKTQRAELAAGLAEKAAGGPRSLPGYARAREFGPRQRRELSAVLNLPRRREGKWAPGQPASKKSPSAAMMKMDV